MNPENFLNSTAGQVIRHPKGYWAFIPAPLPPVLSWPLPLVTILSEAERNLSKLASLAGLLPISQLLVQPFVRREAVISLRIEGTRASLSDLYTYETQLSFLEPATDVQEVHNYVEALDYGLERLKTLPVSLRLIREIHARLMADVRGKHLTPGEFRRSQNWIGPAGSTLRMRRMSHRRLMKCSRRWTSSRNLFTPLPICRRWPAQAWCITSSRRSILSWMVMVASVGCW